MFLAMAVASAIGLYAALGGMPPTEADGLIWSETNRAAVPFLRRGQVLVGLGDPAGDAVDAAIAGRPAFAAAKVEESVHQPRGGSS